MYILSKNVNLAYYVSHFAVQDHFILDEHPQPLHTRLLHSILNPLFSKSSLFILKEIFRLSNKTCIFYETHKASLLPDVFSYLHIVRYGFKPGRAASPSSWTASGTSSTSPSTTRRWATSRRSRTASATPWTSRTRSSRSA